MLLIDLINDLQVSGQQLLHQLHWPALQGLREHRVVGVGEGLLRDLPCLQKRGGPFSKHPTEAGAAQRPPCATGASECAQSGTLESTESGSHRSLYFFQGKKKLFGRTEKILDGILISLLCCHSLSFIINYQLLKAQE